VIYLRPKIPCISFSRLWYNVYMTYELDRNQHSVFSLHYHLVMVVRQRRGVIDHTVSVRLQEIFEHISPNYAISLQNWHSDIDYVYVYFKAEPKTELSKFINAYKSASSRLIKKEFVHMKESLFEETFWSHSYALMSSGTLSDETIQNYVATQRH